MLLQPINLKKTPTKVYFPYGLIILAALSIVFFSFFQLKDRSISDEAINYYFKSGLDEFEVPHYIKFLKKYMRNELYFNLLSKMNQGHITKNELYWIMRNDPLFQGCLDRETCVTADTLSYLKWKENRRKYQRILSNDGFQQYGFKSAAPSLLDLGLSLIISNGIYNFIINMVFLIVFGTAVESKNGPFKILLVYVTCAMVMLCAYALMAQYTLMPIGGAGGGVAGLLGLTVAQNYFGKVNWFYFNGKKINYFSANICYAVGLWLLSKLLVELFTSFDWFCLMAQIFALLAGILLGMMGKPKKVYEVSDINEQNLKNRLNKASELSSKMEYNQAKKILYSLLDEYPNNKEVLFHLYNISKINPDSEEYHAIVQKIFSLKDLSQSTTVMINLVFKNYIRRAKPAIQFNVHIFVNLLHRFRKFGYNDDAEKILKVLARYNSDGKLSETLAREQLLLARNYITLNDTIQSQRLIHSLLEEFPQTKSAQDAKTMVSHNNLH